MTGQTVLLDADFVDALELARIAAVAADRVQVAKVDHEMVDQVLNFSLQIDSRR